MNILIAESARLISSEVIWNLIIDTGRAVLNLDKLTCASNRGSLASAHSGAEKTLCAGVS